MARSAGAVDVDTATVEFTAAMLGWPLRTMPTAPRGRHWRLLAGLVDADPQWLPYLGESAA